MRSRKTKEGNEVEVCGAAVGEDSVVYLVAARPQHEPQVWEGKTFCMSDCLQLALVYCTTAEEQKWIAFSVLVLSSSVTVSSL